MFKALFVASIFFATTIVDTTPPKAEACGVKIGVGSAKGKRRTRTQSQTPSRILVVGKKDQTLIRKLESAGHRVQYASSVEDAKGERYRVVITDANQAEAARDRFNKASIVQRKSRGTADRVETVLARKSSKSSRTTGPTESSPNRSPVETGGENIATNSRTPTEVGTETPTRVAVAEPRVAATATVAPKPERTNTVEATPAVDPEPPGVEKPKVTKPKVERTPTEPKTKAVKSAKWSRQFQFGTNKTNLNASAKRRLKNNAKWLEQNPGSSVTIEGHTDSVGDEAYNMDLSERRANVARDFLLGLGVDDSRITVTPKGEQEPAVEPSTSARNRRIVLIKN